VKHGMLVALLTLASWPAASLTTETAESASVEQMFVTEATLRGLAAVEINKLAQTRSSTPALRTFAGDALRTHGKINAELATVARGRKLEVPAELDDERARMVHSVSTKPPSEFDTEYLKRMGATQEELITVFQNAVGLADKDLAGFAKRTLPALQRQETRLSAVPTSMPTSARGASTPSDRVSVASPQAVKPGVKTPADAAAEAVATDPSAADRAEPDVVAADVAAKRAADAEAAAAAEKSRSDPAQPR
jgi:predicted outer membrane protein